MHCNRKTHRLWQTPDKVIGPVGKEVAAEGVALLPHPALSADQDRIHCPQLGQSTRILGIQLCSIVLPRGQQRLAVSKK